MSIFPKFQNTTSQYPGSCNFKILNARAHAHYPHEFWYSESRNAEMIFFSPGFREPGVQNSRFQIIISSRYWIPKHSSKGISHFMISELLMWRTLLLVNRNTEMTFPKILKFILDYSFRDSRVRVTKGFGLHSGLTNPKFPK
jgi:hypothetical protein